MASFAVPAVLLQQFLDRTRHSPLLELRPAEFLHFVVTPNQLDSAEGVHVNTHEGQHQEEHYTEEISEEETRTPTEVRLEHFFEVAVAVGDEHPDRSGFSNRG